MSNDYREKFEPVVVCGLANLGNTCYFNSGLQLLSSSFPFVSGLKVVSPFAASDAITRRYLQLRGRRFHSQDRQRLVESLGSTLDEMESGTSLQVAPRRLLSAFTTANDHFQGFHQQDAHEMITALLSSVEDETSSAIHKSVLYARLQQAGAYETSEKTVSPSWASLPSSRRFASVVQLAIDVDRDNAELERKESRRAGKGALYNFYSANFTQCGITDCFRGLMLHQVTCHGCSAVSRVIDEFTSLTLEIPTRTQRLAFARAHPHIQRLRFDGTWMDMTQGVVPVARSWWNPIRWMSAFCGMLSYCFGEAEDSGGLSFPLTIQECLDIHFDKFTLRGQDAYKCQSCGQTCEASSQHRILWYPQSLIVLLKRFRTNSYWTSKRGDDIVFLERGGTSSSSSAPNKAPSTTSSDPTVLSRTDDDSGEGPLLDMASFSAEQDPSIVSAETRYSLVSVVNHHGSFNGGHYTSYSRKGEGLGWVLCNDEQVVRVSANTVADSQEYLLLYEKSKQGLTQEHRELQRIARSALADENQVPEEPIRYVSRLWLHRVATFAEPGPLLNYPSYRDASSPSSPTGRTSSGTDRVPVEWLYVPLAAADADRLVKYFGCDGSLEQTATREAVLRHRDEEQCELTQLQ